MFTIMFWDSERLWTEVGEVRGCEAAFEAYRHGCELANQIGADCALVDAETGEVLALYEIED